MKVSPLVNVIDVETTCWEFPEIKPDNEHQEIIEIGIAVIDTIHLELVENNKFLIAPEKSRVTDFCTKLTGLTRFNLQYQNNFPMSLDSFKENYDTNNRLFASWGDFDRKMFESNCKLYNCAYPFGPRHLNIRHLFSLFYNISEELTIKQALNYLDLEFVGREHSGADDARNIATLFLSMLKNFPRK